jgi:hypothetical protein
MTILAPILTREHAHDDDGADEQKNEHDDPGGYPAKRPELQPLIDHLRGVAQGRDDIRAEVAGVVVGSWFAEVAGVVRT